MQSEVALYEPTVKADGVCCVVQTEEDWGAPAKFFSGPVSSSVSDTVG